MTNEELLQDTYYEINNRIQILNARMEAMEKAGEEDSSGYEVLSGIEWKLCDTRHKLRKYFK